MRAIVDIVRAADFAAVAHAGKTRKGERKEPYVNHLTEVARLLAEATDGRDPVLVVAGLLHDTVEDTAVTRADLEREFGPEVAELVMEVTDDKTLPKAERRRRQEEHVRRASARAKMIKLADKTSNLRGVTLSPPADWSPEERREYVEWGGRVADGCRGANARLEAWFDEAYRAALAALGG
jgi:guanosine-3',5'-bis(diphosphate) 3'-pyrophosphohydrolase